MTNDRPGAMVTMKLEEMTQVKLHFVEEKTQEIIHYIYTSTFKDQQTAKPVCFSSRDAAEAYRFIRAKGYIPYGQDEFRHREDDCWIRRISISSRIVMKNHIALIDQVMYYFDKANDKMYEIHDKPDLKQDLEART